MKTVVDSNGEMVADRVQSFSVVCRFPRVRSISVVFCRAVSCCRCESLGVGCRTSSVSTTSKLNTGSRTIRQEHSRRVLK